MSLSELTRCHFLSSDILNLMLLSRATAVETLYAAFPALMYIDPTLGVPLLEPLFQLQAGSGVRFAASDLGVFHRNAKCRIIEIGARRRQLPKCLSPEPQVDAECGSRTFVNYLLHWSSVSLKSCMMHRIREYADHDVRPCPCERKWRPDKQICMSKLCTIFHRGPTNIDSINY